jgi:hypothetical protein
VPRDGPGIRPDAGGEIRLRYRRAGGRLVPPRIFVRLHNTGPRPLWCVLINLTERYRSHTALFNGALVAAGATAAALRGTPIEVTLPADLVRPGATYRDWLRLVVAEEPFNELAFAMPALGTPADRDVQPEHGAGPAGDWATSITALVTEVPAG